MKPMTRLAHVLTLCLPILTASAQTNAPAAIDQPVNVRLRIKPQAPPRMALRHELLPPYDDLRQGNAALSYYIVIVSTEQEHVKEVVAEVGKLLESPDPGQHLEEIEAKLAAYQGKIRDLKRAARYRKCDWQAHWEDGFETLLPYLAPVKRLSRLVLLQTRVDIMKGNFDDAITGLQTCMAMGQHCYDRTFIDGLVCLAITRLGLDTLETYVQTEQAPNLFHALSGLPRPLVNFRDALRFERAHHDDLNMPELRHLETDLKQGKNPVIPMERIVEFAKKYLETNPLQILRDAPQSTRDRALTNARNYLAGQEFLPASIADLTPLETLFLAAFDRFHYVSDFGFKSKTPEQSEEFELLLNEDFAERADGFDPFPFGRKLFPAMAELKRRNGMTERKLDAWRCIEAIRAHAAANDGKLPSSLDAIKVLPIPVNPMTKKPFGYKLAGNTAVLTAAARPIDAGKNTTIYELTVD